MPDNVTQERTQLLRMYGAEIIYSPGEQGSNGAVAMALDLAQADASYYMPYRTATRPTRTPTTTGRPSRSSRSWTAWRRSSAGSGPVAR